ncbi:hypothetical protein WMY93_020590 [Mugilogobius chulae]|uniref:PID domain-containing protein n=1 Tax=Mugilogobius chulae TaxID=88201 RepID=A0AAW0N9G1_9GOBI
MSQKPEGLSPEETESPVLNGTSQSEPVRRSWRPCQMLDQDGEVVHLHQQQHPAPSHRSRRRTHHPQTAPPHRPDPAGPAPNPTPHPRPAVTRYRRHGDPNPRLRMRQQRHVIVEESKDTSATGRTKTHQRDPQTVTSIHSPGGDVSRGLTPEQAQVSRDKPTEDESQDFQRSKKNSCKETTQQDVELSQDKFTHLQEQETEEAHGEEASRFKEELGVNGPLQRGPQPPPIHDTPPEDSDKSDEEEDSSYPQTYADFYSQSHQKSYTEPKQHPKSFPEPLRTAYPSEPERIHKALQNLLWTAPSAPGFTTTTVNLTERAASAALCPEAGGRGPLQAQATRCVPGGYSRGGGAKADPISLAIRGIKEAIEEESSPTDEASPGSPCECPYSTQDPAEASGTYPQTQRDAPTSSQQRVSPAQPQEVRHSLPSFPTFVDVPGPCDPDDLIDGIIFAATYLGCTHLLSERTPSKSARMQQAQEAMSRVRAAQKQAKNRKKGADTDSGSTVEVDLFMSTQRIKVLTQTLRRA